MSFLKKQSHYFLLFCVFMLSLEDTFGAERIRFATFNTSLYRQSEGELARELTSGNSESARKIAEIIQIVRPDVILLNEFDYDLDSNSIDQFFTNYVGVSQNGKKPIDFTHRFSAAVNTGVTSQQDLNNDGKVEGPVDAFGYGVFPGQYGMVVASKYPIKRKAIRTFQRFLWKDMPGALWPKVQTDNSDYYSDDAKAVFRLSSKSHWDVPIDVNGKTIHFLVFHPTPPVFDGPEDRNGRRNHDEIRFWADYISPKKSYYLYDDQAKRGGLKNEARFVIAGDANADPFDGDSHKNAINLLLKHPLVNPVQPSSQGGAEQSKVQGGKNRFHKGSPALDTADFGDTGRASGNLRIDYVLPSSNLTVQDSGVFWPRSDQPGFELIDATDHRLVWVDVSINSD